MQNCLPNGILSFHFELDVTQEFVQRGEVQIWPEPSCAFENFEPSALKPWGFTILHLIDGTLAEKCFHFAVQNGLRLREGRKWKAHRDCDQRGFGLAPD